MIRHVSLLSLLISLSTHTNTHTHTLSNLKDGTPVLGIQALNYCWAHLHFCVSRGPGVKNRLQKPRIQRGDGDLRKEGGRTGRRGRREQDLEFKKHKDNNNNTNRNKEHALQVHPKKLAKNLFEFERGKRAREGPTLYS